MSENHGQERPAYRVLSVKAMLWASGVMAIVTAGVLWWLLATYGGGSERDRASLEAIKTAGAIVVGTGGVAALILAARRQRTTEIALRQKDVDQDHADRIYQLQERIAAENRQHQERVAESTELDSSERRITELYTRAAEQLGSDKPAVRLAGLYALERLAQSAESLRQVVINVLCAYLRIPERVVVDFTSSAIEETENVPEVERGHENGIRDAGERQVRQAAQKILQAHLVKYDELGESVSTKYWPGMTIDLSHAVLDHAKFGDCHVVEANFTETVFHHDAYFDDFRADSAYFGGAEFRGSVVFESAEVEYAVFHELKVNGYASFERCIVGGEADFSGALFDGPVTFSGAIIEGDGSFRSVCFHKSVDFSLAGFGQVGFESVNFESEANFAGASFLDGTDFMDCTFSGDVAFDTEADIELDGSRYRDVGVRDWPEGWTESPEDADDDGWRLVIRADDLVDATD